MTAIGKPPELQWVNKQKLKVDRSYQRGLESARSQKVIARIAETFSWLKFGVLTTTKGLDLVDGQHRHAAALKLGEVTHLPCLVLPISSAAEAAAIFVSINRDRSALTPVAIFKAELAAGADEATAIAKLAKTAGAEVLAYPLASSVIKPTQTMAVSTLRNLFDKDRAILQTALTACVTSGVGLTALAIKAAFRAISEGRAEGLIEALQEMRGVSVDQGSTAPGGRAEAFYQMMTGALARPANKIAAKAPAAVPRKPFMFDRSKTGPPSKPAPVVVKNDVQPRRFEMGACGSNLDYELHKYGFTCKQHRAGSYLVAKIGLKADGRTMTKAELIAFIDKQRKAKGLEPIARRA